MISLGILQLELENYKEAYETFNNAAKIDSNFPDIYLNRTIAECALQYIERLFSFNNVFKNDFISLFNKLSEVLDDMSDSKELDENALNFRKRIDSYKDIVNDTDFKKEFRK